MRYLYKTCSRLALIPRSLEVEVHCDQNDYPAFPGGFADVWKGHHDGREVALKVLRVFSTSDFEQIRKVRYC